MSSDDLNDFDDIGSFVGTSKDYFIGKPVLDTSILIPHDGLKMFQSFARNAGIPIFFSIDRIEPEHFNMLQQNNQNPFNFSVLSVIVEAKDSWVFVNILRNCGFSSLANQVEEVASAFNDEDQQ